VRSSVDAGERNAGAAEHHPQEPHADGAADPAGVATHRVAGGERGGTVAGPDAGHAGVERGGGGGREELGRRGSDVGEPAGESETKPSGGGETANAHERSGKRSSAQFGPKPADCRGR